jgi:hypothetical protein
VKLKRLKSRAKREWPLRSFEGAIALSAIITGGRAM